MRQGEKRHLETNENILNSCGEVVHGVAWHVVWNGLEPDEDGKEETLPIRRKDDALDAQEFGHGSERLQVLCHAHPEHGKSIQTYCDADVVDEALPEVAGGEVDVALFVYACCFHDDASQCEQGLHPCILENTALHSKEGVGVGYVKLGQNEAHGPGMSYRSSTGHEDDEGALAADEVDQELQEGVDGEGLVDVAERVNPGCCLDRHQTAPRGGGVYGDPMGSISRGCRTWRACVHEKNAHDISLQQRLSVVFPELE